MSRTALAPVTALLVGLLLGYLVWGRAGSAANLVALAERLEQHERSLTEMASAESERVSGSLAECEAAQVRIAEKLEECLFSQRKEAAPAPSADAPDRPLSGVSKFTETLDYPVPLEPKNP